jgi:hypothetical protein
MEYVCDGKEYHMQNPVAQWGKILPSVLWGLCWDIIDLTFI